MSDESLRRLERSLSAGSLPEDVERYQHEQDRRADPPPVRFAVAATETGVDEARDRVEKALTGLGAPVATERKVQYLAAVLEALANAQVHGSRPAQEIKVEVRLEDSRVLTTVTDQGKGFDHALYAQVRPNDLHVRVPIRLDDPPGGLGLWLIQRACDEVRFNEAGNEVTLGLLVTQAQDGEGD